MPANTDTPPANITVDDESKRDYEIARPGQTFFGVMHCTTGVISFSPGGCVVSGLTWKFWRGQTPTFENPVVGNITSRGGGHLGMLMQKGAILMRDQYCGFSITKNDSGLEFRDRSGGLNMKAFDWPINDDAVRNLHETKDHDRDLPPAYSKAIVDVLQQQLSNAELVSVRGIEAQNISRD